jgi:hypothetical protein
MSDCLQVKGKGIFYLNALGEITQSPNASLP